jgi:S-methylmethionine-dependent homocysteine/selenocysteine methylase
MDIKSPIRPVVSPWGIVLHRSLDGGLALFVSTAGISSNWNAEAMWTAVLDVKRYAPARGVGHFTPEVAINHPHALRELHEEFLNSGSDVLEVLTFFGTREELGRAGYGA